MSFGVDRETAQRLDSQDPLRPYRDRFVIDDPAWIYLDGNSLGRLPKATVERQRKLVEEAWGRRLIRSWNEGWIELPGRVGAKMARLLGARPDEVIMADSTSVNLFKLALAALQVQEGRSRVVTDNLNFPSDLYVLQGVARLAAAEIELVPSPDGVHGPVEGLGDAIDDRTALVVLSHTTFKSGYTYDMNTITRLAHQAGAMMLWDCSHSVGAMPIALSENQVDLAVGCSYKYLNGGPGAPAFLYVRHDLQESLYNPVSGWMGQRAPFEFGLEYEPAPGLGRFLTGTPPILSLAAVEPGLDLLLEAGIERLRDKSVRQTGYLIDLWREELAPLGFQLNSPVEETNRGSHVTLGHDDAWPISQALIELGAVQTDFRRPDNIRFGIAPLYNSFSDLYEAVARLKHIVVEGQHRQYGDARPVVT
jgi:kynureninase